MRHLLLLAVGFTVFALSVSGISPVSARVWHDDFEPQQPSLTQPGHREWTWDGDDSLSMGTPVALHYSPGGSPRIVVTGPAEIVAHIQEDKGHIRLEEGWHYSNDEKVDVTITGVRIHNVGLAGSGSADLEGLDLDRLQLSVAGNFAVRAQGRADEVALSIAGGGKTDMRQLAARRANIRIAGSNDVWLSPRDQAVVSITGSARVNMAAKPTNLNQTILGPGRVIYPGMR